jgi:hypothetical protein
MFSRARVRARTREVRVVKAVGTSMMSEAAKNLKLRPVLERLEHIGHMRPI